MTLLLEGAYVTTVFKSFQMPSFHFTKIQVELTTKQAILLGVGLGLGTEALKVLATVGVFCGI